MTSLGARVARPLAAAALALAAALCAVVLASALPAFVDDAYASTGYTATATPHYRHPGTGMIEDSGGESSEVLGQSMTDGATYPYAFVEIDDAGNTYVTIRLKLMYAIVDPQFQIDTAWSGVFSSLSSECVQTNDGEDTADFRMLVPSSGEGAVFRCNMYVTPMGREVIFYITLSNYVEGNSYGFYQSASTTSGQGTTTTDTAGPATTDTTTQESSLDTSTLEQTIADAKALSQGTKSDTAWSKLRQAISAAESAIVTAADQAAVDSANETLLAAIDEFNASEDVDPEAESTSGLVEFDAEGNVVSEDEDASGDFPLVPIVIVIVVIVAAAAIGIVAWRRSSAGKSAAAAEAAAAQAAAPAAEGRQVEGQQTDATQRMPQAAASDASASDPTLPIGAQSQPAGGQPGDADATQPLSTDDGAGDASQAQDAQNAQGGGRDA